MLQVRQISALFEISINSIILVDKDTWIYRGCDYTFVRNDKKNLATYIKVMQEGVTGNLQLWQNNYHNNTGVTKKTIHPRIEKGWHNEGSEDTRMHFTISIKRMGKEDSTRYHVYDDGSSTTRALHDKSKVLHSYNKRQNFTAVKTAL